jgi:hypothetical protein
MTNYYLRLKSLQQTNMVIKATNAFVYIAMGQNNNPKTSSKNTYENVGEIPISTRQWW